MISLGNAKNLLTGAIATCFITFAIYRDRLYAVPNHRNSAHWSGQR
ncbi:MAG: hypothetical protein ACFB0G_11875 [Leptolyngbyaceae cyanobacterium]